MGIDFITPLWLIFIPIEIAILIFTSRTLNRKERIRKNTILFMRGIVITFLLLAVAKMGIVWKVNNTSTVFLVHTSDNMKDYNAVSEGFVKEALGLMTDKDTAGIILFGEDPVMENFLSKEPAFEKISGIVAGKYTNLKSNNYRSISLPDKAKKNSTYY